MTDKATPRPWAVHPRMAYIIPAEHVLRPIGGADDDVLDLQDYAQEICAMHHPDRHRSEAETLANAALIVRAVNSHDALVRVTEGVIAYDAILKRYSGPLELLCAGDVAEIDDAYDALIARARQALEAAK